MRAVLRGVTLASSEATIVVEGNHYFPPDSIDWEHLEKSRMVSVCPWKGLARYWNATAADGERSAQAAAWSYPRPFPWIRKIRGHVAFSGEVEVTPH